MRKKTLAVVGLGRIARSHISGIQQWPDLCELGAVVDVDRNRAQSFAQEYDVPYYTSTEEAYADPDIDAAVICVPHHLHAPLAIEACEAGMDVLVEKVMATTLADAEKMVQVADDNNANLMIGQSRRFFPAMREAYNRRNEIGTALNLLYNFACHFDTDTAPPWWKDKQKTGGLAYPMLGSHSIDYTLWMLDDREPVAVHATGASNNPDFEGDDDVTLTIEFDDGTHATNFLSINSHQPKHQGIVIGTEGTIHWEQGGDHSGDLVGIASTDMFFKGETVEIDQNTPHNFAFQMREFVESIQENREPATPGRKIVTQLEIIEKAQQSAKEERVVQL